MLKHYFVSNPNWANAQTKLINLLINMLDYLVSTIQGDMVAFHMILSYGSHYKSLN